MTNFKASRGSLDRNKLAVSALMGGKQRREAIFFVRMYLLVEEASFRWNFEHFSSFYGFAVCLSTVHFVYMVDKYDSYYNQSVWFQVGAILDFFLLRRRTSPFARRVVWRRS